jgi:16S rRNA (adenine1518-N6/adenine1519-N6)-dimethyltransferase
MLKKSLSQNLLKDKNLLDKMARLAGITKDDTVVEIGAGHGDLTRALAAQAGFVHAVELDQRFRVFLEPLEGELGNVRMTFGSILGIPLDTLVSKPVKVMGNIPYHITGDILFKLLYERQLVISAFLTMQREVAERLVASPHTRAYGAL